MKRTKKFFLISTLVGAGISLTLFFTNCAGQGFELMQQTCVSDTGDPFLTYSWHLGNCGQTVFASSAAKQGVDLNLLKTWEEGIYGKGIKVRISDDGLEDTHEDLRANFAYTTTSKDYTGSSPWTATTAPPHASDDNHGTSVAGLIAAVGWNGVGSRGVAPKATLSVANFLSGNVTQTDAMFYDQAQGTFDVLNMSWGASQNDLTSPDPVYEAILKTTVTNNRSGKGAILVKAAGNDFVVACHGTTTTACIGGSNFDGDDTNPYSIVVAALNAKGYSSSYSSAGSNLWISGFGGEYGDDTPAMLTTDRMGCSKGWAVSNSTSKVSFEKGANGNGSCNYTATFNGTSSAAPTVAGVAALLLEANPNLTWRDVKYILAKTAVPMNYVTNGSIKHPLSGVTLPSGYVWEQAWVVNNAGFPFHNWYGFGKVDVDRAVALAKSYTSSLGTYTETNWAHSLAGLSIAIPDFTASGATSSITVASGDNVKIEAVRLKLSVTHADVSELAVELTSPSGTKSILVNMRNSLTGIANYSDDIFLSNAFYQENSQGTWTLKVIDGRVGNTGTITKWSLDFAGGR